MTMAIHWRTGIVLLVLLALPGCSLFQPPELKDPTLSLERIAVLQMGITEQRFMLTIDVDNPNRQSLAIRSIRYDLEVGGMPFASGATDKRFSIAGADTTSIEIEARTQLLGNLPALARMATSGNATVPYQIQGEVEYGRFFRGSRDFEQTGQVRLLPAGR